MNTSPRFSRERHEVLLAICKGGDVAISRRHIALGLEADGVVVFAGGARSGGFRLAPHVGFAVLSLWNFRAQRAVTREAPSVEVTP